MDLKQHYAGKTVLVTGGAGFIGSHLVDKLVDIEARVRAMDDLSDGVLDNLALSRDRIDFSRRSVTDPAGLDDLVTGCDYVFHLAANASVPRSVEEPARDFETNVVGTYQVMEACRRTGAGRLIVTSSAGVYGEPRSAAMDEDHPTIPKSPYGGSKLAGEHLVAAYARCFDFDHRRVRIFNTFGPRQRRYVMFDLLEKLRRDPHQLEVLGTGEQIRTYNYVADTVEAFLLIGAHPEARGQVYNIGGLRQISIKELVGLVIELLAIEPPEVTYTGQSWPGDIVRLFGDSQRLHDLGFQPVVGLEEGLHRLIDWFRELYSPPW